MSSIIGAKKGTISEILMNHQYIRQILCSLAKFIVANLFI